MIKDIEKNGFVLMEMIIAIALIGIAFVTLLGIAPLVINISSSIQKQTQANFLIKEEFEALRNYRDGTTWTANGGLGNIDGSNNNFTGGTSGAYHLVNSSGNWTLAPLAETMGIFTRQIIFDKVSRDSVTGNIETVYNSSRNDADTIKVTITVTWPGKTLQDVSYLTNWVK